jgi:hypothetical protein
VIPERGHAVRDRSYYCKDKRWDSDLLLLAPRFARSGCQRGHCSRAETRCTTCNDLCVSHSVRDFLDTISKGRRTILARPTPLILDFGLLAAPKLERQLGKLDVSQGDQGHSCKTARLSPKSHQWVTDGSQNASAPLWAPRGRKYFDRTTLRRREIERHAIDVGAADTDDLSRWLIAWVWHNPIKGSGRGGDGVRAPDRAQRVHCSRSRDCH